MTPSPGITLLLREARAAALAAHAGRPASDDALAELAADVRREVLHQVDRGEWTPHGVLRIEAMLGLRVTVVPGRTLLGEPPLRIEFDFARTALPLLVVRSEKARKE